MPQCYSSVLCKPVIISLSRLKQRKKANLARPFSIQHIACAHGVPTTSSKKSDIVLNSLRVLEWHRLCDVVSSFACTSLGAEAAKEQLWSLDQTYEESLRLLRETNAAIEIYKFNNVILDLSGINAPLARSAIDSIQRGFPVTGKEAITVAALLQFADTLQINIKAAIKDNAEMYSRFVPLVKPILTWIVNGPLIKFIRQNVDEDGSVKDSASPTLRKARESLQELERKLYRLLNSLVIQEPSKAMQVSNIDGRWCLRSDENDELTSIDGLLLFSGSDVGSVIEPLSAVPLNDELQQARVLVTNAEAEVLLQLTSKMQADLDDMDNLLCDVIHLDAIVARASYSISFEGVCPELLPPEYKPGPFVVDSPRGESNTSGYSNTSKKEWILYMPKAYHPLLLEQHRQHLKKAKDDVDNAKAEVSRKRVYGGVTGQKESKDRDIRTLLSKVSKLENARPVPVDFYIEKKTRVLLITGPNTGGKTICMKTLGLAALMAKSGLYVLCTESARIPWFESVFADIGDEQSLSQSLSTFSGHLKQISDIQAKSSSQSLVLLDEIGAGTNPLEGAALGMSILESFAEADALLTIATTHHGELKTLKYSNDAFENACMEFDEVNLKPTYRILWGIPGRSNAINVAERLGLPQIVIDNARDLYGSSSSEIDEVIVEMEKFKHDIQENVDEAKHYLMLSRDLHEKLLISQREHLQHRSNLRYQKGQQVAELAIEAYSLLHKKMQQHRASIIKVLNQPDESIYNAQAVARNQAPPVPQKVADRNRDGIGNVFPDPTIHTPLKIGDLVLVPSLGMKATVLKVEQSKNELVVLVGNMKMKLKVTDVKRS